MYADTEVHLFIEFISNVKLSPFSRCLIRKVIKDIKAVTSRVIRGCT